MYCELHLPLLICEKGAAQSSLREWGTEGGKLGARACRFGSAEIGKQGLSLSLSNAGNGGKEEESIIPNRYTSTCVLGSIQQ